MLTKLDKDRASMFRRAVMRANYMSINCVDVQQAMKEVARFMAEPNEGAWSMEHAQASGSILCGSRRARAGDLGAEVREGTTHGHRQRLRWMRAYQEEHDVCSFIFSMASTFSKPHVGRRVRAVV